MCCVSRAWCVTHSDRDPTHCTLPSPPPGANVFDLPMQMQRQSFGKWREEIIKWPSLNISMPEPTLEETYFLFLLVYFSASFLFVFQRQIQTLKLKKRKYHLGDFHPSSITQCPLLRLLDCTPSLSWGPFTHIFYSISLTF